VPEKGVRRCYFSTISEKDLAVGKDSVQGRRDVSTNDKERAFSLLKRKGGE